MIELSDEVDGQPYEILEPILNLLLENGNEIKTDYRWGSNPTGYFCILTKDIDFELVEKTFKLPCSVQLMRKYGSIDYGLGTAIIRSA